MNDKKSSSPTPPMWSAPQLAILQVIRAIKVGEVCGYGEVAKRAGIARGARQVVWVLKNAPASMALPWYRVLRSDGRIAFEAGSAPFKRQTRLLKAEGVVVRNGKVAINANSKKTGKDLDQILWG